MPAQKGFDIQEVLASHKLSWKVIDCLTSESYYNWYSYTIGRIHSETICFILYYCV